MIKRKFILTAHARKRIYQRNMKDPNNIADLRIAKNKVKKRIRAICAKNGYKTDRIYWRDNTTYKKTAVYVCKTIGIAKYLVITAFFLE